LPPRRERGCRRAPTLALAVKPYSRRILFEAPVERRHESDLDAQTVLPRIQVGLDDRRGQVERDRRGQYIARTRRIQQQLQGQRRRPRVAAVDRATFEFPRAYKAFLPVPGEAPPAF